MRDAIFKYFWLIAYFILLFKKSYLTNTLGSTRNNHNSSFSIMKPLSKTSSVEGKQQSTSSHRIDHLNIGNEYDINYFRPKFKGYFMRIFSFKWILCACSVIIPKCLQKLPKENEYKILLVAIASYKKSLKDAKMK